MKIIKTLLLGAITLGTGLATASATDSDSDPLSAAQQDAVKDLVKSYLKEHPEVVVDAIQAWQSKQAALKAEQQKKSIAMLNASLEKDTGAPFLGNQKAQTVLVEFSDYNCPYCKRTYPGIKDLLVADGDIKLVLMEFPVLGPMSVFAARAALASHIQGKYEAFHSGMMMTGSRLDQAGVLSVASKAGLDLDKLKLDMESPEVAQELESNIMMAQMPGITGTPAFIIGEQLVPGAISKDKLKALVEKSRGK